MFNPSLTYNGAYNGPLYGTWEHASYKDEETYFNSLRKNGINFIISPFSIIENQSREFLVNNEDFGKVLYLVQKYPKTIVPVFNMGVGRKNERIYLGDKLTSFYREVLESRNKIAEGVLRGFGEIETQEWPKPHNSKKIMQLFALAKDNGLFVMLHPLPGQKDAIKNIVETYPDTIFLIHVFSEDFSKDKQNIIQPLKKYDNLYFSIDADHMMFNKGVGMLYRYKDYSFSRAKSRFIQEFNKNQDILLNNAILRYSSLVEEVPDKVMWGTEASPLYNFEPEVYDRIIKFSRMFIGSLKPEYQEMIAYKNALRVFGKGVELNKTIEVKNSEDLEKCEEEACERECILKGPEDSLENEICISECESRRGCVVLD